MSQSIKNRMAVQSNKRDALELRKLLEAIRVDLAALRATVAANVIDVDTVADALDTLATKLNADGGVTDVDYATDTAASLTSSAPSALTLGE